MFVKQRINFLIMRAIAARGLSFAFPSQTVYLEGDAVQKMATRSAGPDGAASSPSTQSRV